MRKLATLAVLLMAGVCFGAQTVTLSIEANEPALTWTVYASCPNDGTTVGLSSFALTVDAVGVTIDSSLNESPVDTDWTWGFKEFRSDGTNGVGIQAGQKTIYGSSYNATLNGKVLQKVGIIAGSKYDATLEDYVYWTAPVKIASGTYTPAHTVGTITAHVQSGGSFNLLKNTGSGTWRGPGNTQAGDTVVSASVEVPEPATIALLVLGLGLLRRRS